MSNNSADSTGASWRRRRARWALAGAIGAVVVIGGVVPLPGYFVRWKLLPELKGALPGLSVGDYSAGWLSGITLRDVKLVDARGGEMISSPRVHSDWLPLKALSGKYLLGDVEVADARVQLRLGADGTTNLDSLLGGPAEGSSVRLVGRFKGKVAGAVVELPGGVEPVRMEGGEAVVSIDTIDKSATSGFEIRLHSDSQNAGLALTNRSLELTNVALGHPIYSALVSGTLERVEAGGTTAVRGKLGAPEVVVALPAEETVRLREVSVPVDVSWATAAGPTRVAVKELAVRSAEGAVSAGGEFTLASVTNLLAGRPAGEAGTLRVTAEVPALPSVAEQLRRTLHLEEDVRVTGGHLRHQLDATWTAGEVTFATGGDFTVAGTNGGRAVSIAPVTLSARGKAKPVAGSSVPDLSDLVATVASPFMTLEARADSLSAIRATGTLSLDELLRQADQFVDLGGLSAAGTGTFELETTGALSAAKHPVDVRTKVSLSGIRVRRADGRTVVDEPKLSLSGGARLDRAAGASGVAGRVKSLTAHLDSRSGTLELVGESLAALTVRADLDLAVAREQVNTFVDLGTVRAGGRAKLTATTSGNTSDPAAPLAAKVALSATDLSLTGVEAVGPINAGGVTLEASGTLNRSAGGEVTGVSGLAAEVSAGDGALQLAGTADVDVVTGAVPAFAVRTLTADVARLQAAAPGLVPAWRLQVPAGTVTAGGVAGSWKDGVLALPTAATVTLTNFSIGPTGISAEGLPVRGESGTVKVAGRVGRGEAELSTLLVETSSKLLEVRAAGPVVVRGWGGVQEDTAGQAGHGTGGKGADWGSVAGDVTVSGDLTRLARVVRPYVGEVPTGPQTRVDAHAVVRPGADGSHAIGADVTLSPVLLPPYLTGAPIRFNSKSTLAPGAAALDFAATLESPVLSATLTNGRYELANPRAVLASLTRVDVAATVPNLALVPSPVPVASGELKTRASVSREGNVTTVKLADTKATGLALAAGGPKSDATLGAVVTLTDAGGGALGSVRVSDARLGLGPLATVTLTEPLVLSDFGLPHPSVTGVVRATGEFGPVYQWLASASGMGPAGVTAGGTYTLTQKLAPDAGRVRATGELVVSDFALASGKEGVFADPRVTVTNDLVFDLTPRTLTANALKVAPSGGAVAASVTGRVLNWHTTRALDNVRVEVEYDWARVWPLVWPHCPEAWQRELAEVKVAGRHTSTFDVRGAIPGQYFDPLRQWAVSGAVSVASAEYRDYQVTELTVPLLLQNGSLRTNFADGRGAAPAKFNEGTLDVSDVTADLTTPGTVRVSVPRDKVVLKDVRLNDDLANDVLARLTPLFVGAREADARLSLTVVECERLDPRELMNLGASARNQRLQLLFTATDLRLSSTMTDTLATVIDPPAFTVPVAVPEARVTLQDGQSISDVTVRVAADSEVALRGTVRLSDQTLMPLSAIVAKRLLPAARQAGPAAVANLPEKVELPFDGTAGNPQPRMSELARKIMEAAAKPVGAGAGEAR